MPEDTSEEILTGREGVEANQGWSQMPGPAEPPDKIDTESPAFKHLTRPEDPLFDVEREYFDPATGKPRDEHEAVPLEKAADDLHSAREQEQAARERQSSADLASALDQINKDQQPTQQDQQPSEPQPSLDELQLEQMDDDSRRALAESKWREADEAISKVLEDPLIRERVESSFNQVRTEADAKVAQATQVAEAFANHYKTQIDGLVGEANALLVAQFPELSGAQNPDQLRGALAALQSSNPARAQAFVQLASRAQGLVEAQQRQQHQAQQALALQRDYELQQFEASEIKRFEEATKYEPAESMKAVRENLYPTIAKNYGITKQQMDDLYTGRQRVNSAAFMRSSAFQLMLKDAVSFRLSKDAITRARHVPVPSVQKPGVSAGQPRGGADSDVSALWANLDRNNEGLSGIRAAADLVTARRRARG